MIHHPGSVFSKTQTDLIRNEAAAAEQLGKLTAPLLQLVYDHHWFKMLVPARYGGLQSDLPQVVKIEEALSWADGSLGWVVTLCSGAGWFGGFISPELAPGIFRHPQLCIAGSGASTGTAEVVGDGYLLNGLWKYASGVHHATHITVNCLVTQNGKSIAGSDGKPLIKAFIVDKKKVKLQAGWKYMGMIATGSDAYIIGQEYVSMEHLFSLEPASAIVRETLYLYPFLQLAEATLAANLSGMAVHFTDLCAEIISDKITNNKSLSSADLTKMQEDIEVETKRLNDARTLFYDALHRSWNKADEQQLLLQVSITSRRLAQVARQSVDNLYPYAGLKAAATGTEINRVWCDLHTASQHSLLTFETPPG